MNEVIESGESIQENDRCQVIEAESPESQPELVLENRVEVEDMLLTEQTDIEREEDRQGDERQVDERHEDERKEDKTTHNT